MIREILRSVILNKVNQRKASASCKPFMGLVSRSFRVGLMDIDFNMHINNARYMVFMERARWDHPVQTHTWDVMLKEKLNFIVAGIEMGYIREIRLGKKFEVETQYLGWDEKYFYLEQRFVADGKIHAYGLVKAIFLQQGKKAKPEQVAKILGIKQASEALPEHMELWKRLSNAKRNFSSPSPLPESVVSIAEKNAA
ncbi:MAG: thioesterase family protein [Oleispira sp.]|nr:thioesterase family protein [Oleispira sp.]